ERVRRFRDELGETQPAPARESGVEELREHVDRVLAQPDQEPHYRSLSDRLLFQASEFKLDHPTLAASMQALADALAKVGI
ncbi:MAG: DUF4404 family protein, partial [Kofleriaceae bacterium]